MIKCIHVYILKRYIIRWSHTFAHKHWQTFARLLGRVQLLNARKSGKWQAPSPICKRPLILEAVRFYNQCELMRTRISFVLATSVFCTRAYSIPLFRWPAWLNVSAAAASTITTSMSDFLSLYQKKSHAIILWHIFWSHILVSLCCTVFILIPLASFVFVCATTMLQMIRAIELYISNKIINYYALCVWWWIRNEQKIKPGGRRDAIVNELILVSVQFTIHRMFVPGWIRNFDTAIVHK